MVSKIAQRVKAPSKKTDELGSSPGIHVIEGENSPHKLSSDHTQMGT